MHCFAQRGSRREAVMLRPCPYADENNKGIYLATISFVLAISLQTSMLLFG